MDRSVVILSLGLVGATLVGERRPGGEPSRRAPEVQRLERHFDSVDVELRSRDVSYLAETQLTRRAQMIAWLRDYRNAATFPTNDRFTVPTPFFRDNDGILCAMAYLIARSGRSDIVNKVAATRNNAYIRELADDPALVAWLDSSGLSVAEAGRIQPSYGGEPGLPDDAVGHEVDDDVALAAIGLGSVSLATAAVNIVKPGYFSGFLGVIAGTASIIAGASWMDENDGTKHVGTATIAIGAASLGAGIYGLLEARSRDNDHDRYRDRGRRRRYSVRLVPDVTIQRAEPRAGLLLRGKF